MTVAIRHNPKCATSRKVLEIVATAEHPILIERPVVHPKKGVRPCRPPERVKEIL